MDDKQMISFLLDYIQKEKDTKEALKAIQAGDTNTAISILSK